MKVIIAGGRDFECYETVVDFIKRELDIDEIAEVVSGCARGGDKMGELWAANHRKKITRFPAFWEVHGKKAGLIRNVEMAHYGDVLVAFHDGESKGTRHMIDVMKRMGKEVYVCQYQK